MKVTDLSNAVAGKMGNANESRLDRYSDIVKRKSNVNVHCAWDQIAPKRRMKLKCGLVSAAPTGSGRLRGARKGVGTSSFRAVKRTADVFWGRVHKDTLIQDIKDYVKDTFNVDCLNIEKLEIKTEVFNALKITVSLSDRDLLLKPNLWPEDVVVGKYYNRLKNRNSSN